MFPQQSRRSLELNRVTERYFGLLQQWDGEEKSEALREAESSIEKLPNAIPQTRVLAPS